MDILHMAVHLSLCTTWRHSVGDYCPDQVFPDLTLATWIIPTAEPDLNPLSSQTQCSCGQTLQTGHLGHPRRCLAWLQKKSRMITSELTVNSRTQQYIVCNLRAIRKYGVQITHGAWTGVLTQCQCRLGKWGLWPAPQHSFSLSGAGLRLPRENGSNEPFWLSIRSLEKSIRKSSGFGTTRFPQAALTFHCHHGRKDHFEICHLKASFPTFIDQ